MNDQSELSAWAKEIARSAGDQVLEIIDAHNLLFKDDGGYAYIKLNGEEVYCYDDWGW